jgi:ubiquinone/menaquinone biosynthesis C-methylase UbiE
MIDKYNVLDSISKMKSVVLELGVGNRKRISSAIGIDIIDGEGVDIVGDATEILKEIKDNSIDQVYSFHFLEHVDNHIEVVNEIIRVLKKNGFMNIVVPHFSNPFYYSDPTHKSKFGLFTFCYFAKSKIFSRTFPKYCQHPNALLVDVKLGFKSYRPYYLRHGFKKLLEIFFNSTRYFQEMYEENFTWIFPCYEIKYKIKKK